MIVEVDMYFDYPALHPLAPVGNVATGMLASPATCQPWHLEHLGLVLEEKGSVAAKQNKALLSGTFWTCPIPQPP